MMRRIYWVFAAIMLFLPNSALALKPEPVKVEITACLIFKNSESSELALESEYALTNLVDFLEAGVNSDVTFYTLDIQIKSVSSDLSRYHRIIVDRDIKQIDFTYNREKSVVLGIAKRLQKKSQLKKLLSGFSRDWASVISGDWTSVKCDAEVVASTSPKFSMCVDEWHCNFVCNTSECIPGKIR